MPYEFKTERRVEFVETDMAGILHFSNYFRYMEAAEHDFLRSLGLRVHKTDASGSRMEYGGARRTVSCSYLAPLCYQDIVEIQVLVKEKRTRSISYVVVFRKKPDLTEVARGEMVVVFVTKTEDGKGLTAIPIPKEIDAIVQAAPPELLT